MTAVLGIRVLCSRNAKPPDGSSQSFDLARYVMLDDGQSFYLNNAPGFTVTVFGMSADDYWDGFGLEGLVSSVTGLVEGDGAVEARDEDEADFDSWGAAVNQLKSMGVEITRQELIAMPITVELAEESGDRLRQAKRKTNTG
ncbi:MAG: hypothetical protein LBO75_01430 [Bifidobacteriaceae bacterium]|nr:hypothetical protein [Bifidobacteriaceae bacterium]